MTLTAQPAHGTPLHVNFDNATKLLSFDEPYHAWVGAVTYGQAAIGLRTAHSFLPEFEASLPATRLTVDDFAQQLSAFYLGQWQAGMPANYQGPDMTFVVGGFDVNEPYGNVYIVEIPSNPQPVAQGKIGDFGITWGGQREFVDRLIQGFDSTAPDLVAQALGLTAPQRQQFDQALAPLQMPIPLQAMPLQDCVDLAIFFIRTTIGAQNLTVGIRGCGGFIDVATITRREGLRFIQRKELRGEADPLPGRRAP